MNVSLEPIERKVEQILAVCASLRGENQALRAHVTSLEADKDALTRKIGIARERLETLMAQVPDE